MGGKGTKWKVHSHVFFFFFFFFFNIFFSFMNSDFSHVSRFRTNVSDSKESKDNKNSVVLKVHVYDMMAKAVKKKWM